MVDGAQSQLMMGDGHQKKDNGLGNPKKIIFLP